MAAKTEAMKRLPGRWRLGLWLGLVVLLGGVLVLGARVYNRHLVVAGSIPLQPALGGLPPELGDRINREERSARGYFHPAAGLAALSRLYHANGFYDEAMQCYDGLQQLDPGEARWPHLQASILAEFGRLDEALGPRQRSLVLAPGYLPVRLRLGDVLLKANQAAAAAGVYTAVLALQPDNPYALLGLARCALVGGDWQKARDHLAQAIRQHPDFVGALSLMVTVSEHLGDQAGADSFRAAMGKNEFVDVPDEWLDSLAEDCYDPYRLSVAAAVANAAGNPTVARRRLERAIELAPDTGSYRRQLATLLTREGEPALARQHLERAVAVAPEDADAWLLLVQNLAATGDSSGAERVLANGLAVCPQSPSLHLERARRLNSVGRSEEAIAEFRESYRLRPSEASPLVELASVYFSLNRTEEASAAVHEALRKQPEHPIALATLALIAINAGDEAGARAWWIRLSRQPSTPPQVMNTVRQAFQQHFGRPLD